jgi:lipopolysaccharide/colanic/teichoic acid biosynthesis glycosyltransferase
VGAVVRETDIVGWISTAGVLGVVLTELAPSDEPLARNIESRLRSALAATLPAETFDGLATRLHFTLPSSEKRPSASAWAMDPALRSLQPENKSFALRDGIKRIVDIVGSAALLLASSPLLLAIAALIKLKSPGPIFFRQVRVGQNAEPFTMLKFRSMHANADFGVHQAYVTQFIKSGAAAGQAGSAKLFKLTGDSRITPIGRLLRKTSLDELPQLWNVFRGEMSLVGPRPPLPYEVEQYQAWHRRRILDAKPGITGLWQVTGRSRTTFDEMVRLDLRYAKTRSFWTDIKILLATPRAVIDGKGAC